MALPAPEILDVLGVYRALLSERFGARLERLTLFGSQARGDARPESDVDVLVVLEAPTHEERAEVVDLAHRASRAMGRTAPLLSLLVWSRDERLDRLGRERRIALDIEREGIAV